jgi:hypothetical protein
VNREERTSRLTVLIDPRKKAVFDALCAREDTTPSQVVRRLIRQYIEDRLGHPWVPPEPGGDAKDRDPAPLPKAARRRSGKP